MPMKYSLTSRSLLTEFDAQLNKQERNARCIFMAGYLETHHPERTGGPAAGEEP
jgi:hypothetical protein